MHKSSSHAVDESLMMQSQKCKTVVRPHILEVASS